MTLRLLSKRKNTRGKNSRSKGIVGPIGFWTFPLLNSLLGGGALVAEGTANPDVGSVPLRVDFTGVGKGGKPPYTYFWQFDDGAIDSDQNPRHTFTSRKEFRIVLRVTDSEGKSVEDIVFVSVN